MPQLSMHSPVGDITVSEQRGFIVALDWGWVPDQSETPALAAARDQLERYFDGCEITFDLPLAPHGTRYQKQVWQALGAIPYGTVVSYGDIARTITSAPRAVGGACGRNPIPIIVPCHRVLAARGTAIGGFSADGGTTLKRQLLVLEGLTPP